MRLCMPASLSFTQPCDAAVTWYHMKTDALCLHAWQIAWKRNEEPGQSPAAQFASFFVHMGERENNHSL